MPYKTKEETSANKRKYYQKNRTAIRAKQATYREENADKLKAAELVRGAERNKKGEYKAYYAKNKVKLLARCRAYRLATPERQLWSNASQRAKKFELPFNITPDDIVIPSHCPVFGHEFILGKGKHFPWAPSLDKIVPELGYVKGNIQVISYRANKLKGDATLEELKLLTGFLEKINTSSTTINLL
jgi:hypothetical protein